METPEKRHKRWVNFMKLPDVEKRWLYLKELYEVLKGNYKEGIEEGLYMFSSKDEVIGIKCFFKILPDDNRDKIFERFIKEVEKEFYAKV